MKIIQTHNGLDYIVRPSIMLHTTWDITFTLEDGPITPNYVVSSNDPTLEAAYAHAWELADRHGPQIAAQITDEIQHIVNTAHDLNN